MNELQSRLERLEKRQAKTTRAIERVQSELKEAQAIAVRRKALTIEVGGLLWARVNLGTDIENPNGKHYTFDEAQAACPAGWAVPTREQWRQLYANTTNRWTMKRGIVFIDQKNGNELFLPAAGYRYCNGGTLGNVGSDAWYWSSSVYGANLGWGLEFNSGGVNPEYRSQRGYGFSVRCVLNVSEAR